MAAATHDRFEIKLVQLPGWAIPLAAAAAVAIVALAGVVGFGILLLMSPIILGTAAAHVIRNRGKSTPVAPRPWPKRPLSTPPREPIVIDGEYEVVDGRASRGKAADDRNTK